MCISDVVGELLRRGIDANIWQIRRAVDTCKVPRPKKDGSKRFKFEEEHIACLEKYFRSRSDSELYIANWQPPLNP